MSTQSNTPTSHVASKTVTAEKGVRKKRPTCLECQHSLDELASHPKSLFKMGSLRITSNRTEMDPHGVCVTARDGDGAGSSGLEYLASHLSANRFLADRFEIENNILFIDDVRVLALALDQITEQFKQAASRA